MNPPAEPQIKNVTPMLAGAPVPAVKRRSPLMLVLLVVVLIGIGIGVSNYMAGAPARHFAGLADDVTKAIANNDMSPVINDFNAERWPELRDRARVGNLSNMVTALGAFKGSQEITPAGSPVGFHQFTETFASGTLQEKYQLDEQGKIAKFHIGPPPTP